MVSGLSPNGLESADAIPALNERIEGPQEFARQQLPSYNDCRPIWASVALPPHMDRKMAARIPPRRPVCNGGFDKE
ncbi:hypothetical protein GCM10010924_00410 [Rhizobium wenxiniae]|nr:hypothetical protein GCM10010924_00410 [Rhizobium wenxiniae]